MFERFLHEDVVLMIHQILKKENSKRKLQSVESEDEIFTCKNMVNNISTPRPTNIKIYINTRRS